MCKSGRVREGRGKMRENEGRLLGKGQVYTPRWVWASQERCVLSVLTIAVYDFVAFEVTLLKGSLD